MKIAIITAHDEHLLIGRDGSIPWHYSEDLKHFKKQTMGHPIIMGRITFESIGNKPLPGRTNVILSRNSEYRKEFSDTENVRVYHKLEQALEELEREKNDLVHIIGGAVLYQQSLDLADYLNITLIHHTYKGDTYFPEYRDQIGVIWEETKREDYEDFSFIDYRRIT